MAHGTKKVLEAELLVQTPLGDKGRDGCKGV